MLTGRDDELAAVGQMLEAARQGSGGALLVSGEPGIGKSALLETVAAEAADCIVPRASGVESESALAYAGLHELVRPLEPCVRELPKTLRDPLLRAVRLDAATDGSVVGAALATLLLLAAERKPVLILIDDVQWLDASSARAVLFSARRLRHARVLSLVALREDAIAPVPLDGLKRLHLQPLDDHSSEELAARTIADATQRDVVRRLAAGNPLAIMELGRALTGAGGTVHDVADRLFGSRIAQLDNLEREALLTVALESSGDELVLSRAAGETAVLDRLCRLGLVRRSAGHLEPRHPLVRSLALDRSTAEERRRVHSALASAVAPGDVRTRHLALAAEDPDEALAADLEDLGLRAGISGDGAWALERAAALTPAGPARARRWVRAAQAVWDSGDVARARILVGEANTSADPEARHKSAVLEARMLIAEGGLVEGARMLTRLADDVTAGNPAEAAELLIESALALASAHQVAAGLDVIRGARGLQLGDDPVVRLGTASAEADLRWLSGDVSGAVRQVRAAARAADRDPRVHANRRTRLRLAEAYFGCADYQRAREIAQAVVRDARAGAALADLRFALSILFSVELRSGRVRAMSVAAYEELELATQFGLLMEQEEALGHVAWCDALTGQAETCRSRVAQRLELGARTFANPVPHASLGVLELGIGRPQQAIAALRRTMDALSARDLPSAVSLMPHRPDLIEAYVHAGDVAAASSELAELEHEARTLGTADGLALLHRCRGLLAGPASIDEEFTRALDYDEQEPRPLDRARSLLCWGESLRRTRRRADARTPLLLAFEQFSRLGADLWTPRAFRELDAVGRRDLPHPDKPAVRLTRSEMGVAALVTEGMSNREVATTLFVSINTVETHLRHLFAKLGVRSRTELARRFTVIRDSDIASDS